MVHLAPSILSANFLNLGADLDEMENAGVKYIHVDIMDGHFVPNISFGSPVIKSIAPHIKGNIDVHLMVTNPEDYIDQYVKLGAKIITVHYEACTHLNRVISTIKKNGILAGIAINPATPVNLLVDIIDSIDLVLVMSVDPGFGGQEFITHALTKIEQVRELSSTILIEVDGGINLHNVKQIINSGANLIVAGSSVFENGKINDNVKNFYKIFEE
ncbi:ribulose-phosphate 3-epimerase [Candidatus Epulonipiscioides saccharophilum]|nr:ribulose-phosphate 3-epimerase [Epulopiscium sp. SCG-B10WGA-EpuloB]